MARLTDEQHKSAIVDRANGLSYRQISAKYDVSETTIRRHVKGDPETAEIVAQKKEQNTADILEHMDANRDRVCEIIDVALQVLPQKIADAKSASEVTTALGTLIDKWTMVNGKKDSENGLLADLIDGLKDED